jgi:hypothetical protein
LPERQASAVMAAASLGQVEAAALGFKVIDNHVYLVRHRVHGVKRIDAAKRIDLVEHYKIGKLHLVIEVLPGWGFPKYNLVFSAVPFGSEEKPFARPYDATAIPMDGDSRGDNEAMLVKITELVETPEGLISSFIRFERAYDRNEFGDIFAPSPYVVFDIIGSVSEGNFADLASCRPAALAHAKVALSSAALKLKIASVARSSNFFWKRQLEAKLVQTYSLIRLIRLEQNFAEILFREESPSEGSKVLHMRFCA